MNNILIWQDNIRSNDVVMMISSQLIEAIRLYVFIERDLAALNGHSPTLDPDLLARNRHNLEQRIVQVAALIETDEELMDHPALAAEMVWLFDEVRANPSRHQEKWPPESAAVNIEGYRASAEELQESSNAFRNWCDMHLHY
jgi:hypothetical protein